jgi:hypothetical protein
MTSNRIRRSWSEFNDIKDRMKTAHGLEKFQMIGTTTNLFDYFKRTQTLMRQLLGRLGSLNVTCIKVYLISRFDSLGLECIYNYNTSPYRL